jgi:hypothetical protein
VWILSEDQNCQCTEMNALVCRMCVSEASDIYIVDSTGSVIKHISTVGLTEPNFLNLQIVFRSTMCQSVEWLHCGMDYWVLFLVGADTPFSTKSRQVLAYPASSALAAHRYSPCVSLWNRHGQFLPFIFCLLFIMEASVWKFSVQVWQSS